MSKNKEPKAQILEMVLFLKNLKDTFQDEEVSILEAGKIGIDFKGVGELLKYLDDNRKVNAQHPMLVYDYVVHKVYPRIKASEVDDYIKQSFYLFSCIKNTVKE